MNGQEKFKIFFSAALFLHAVILLIFILNFEWTSKLFVTENSNKNNNIINAVVINAAPGVEIPKKAAPTPLPSTPKPEPKPVSKPVPKPEVKPDPKPVPKLVEQKKAIAILDARKKQQQQIEKQLLADMKSAAEKQKKMKHKALAKAFEEELKEQAEKNLQNQLLKESSRLASAQSQQVQGEVNKYKALILQAISQRWLVPPTVNKKLSCEVLIRLAPGGLVLDAQISKSSGDVSLDRSARAAVFKASPLPVPKDSSAFEPFRQFVLKVRPENIMSSDSDLHG